MASTLEVAVERENWLLAALCLLLGVAQEASRLPPETLDRLLELLEPPDRGRRRACVARWRAAATTSRAARAGWCKALGT